GRVTDQTRLRAERRVANGARFRRYPRRRGRHSLRGPGRLLVAQLSRADPYSRSPRPPYNGLSFFDPPPFSSSPMNETRTVTLENRDEAVQLFGPRDAYLRMVRDALAVRLIARGDTLTIDGPDEAVDQADRVFQQIRKLLKQQGEVQPEDVRTAL